MSIIELGALGEFVGAFAVVITLVFVALQLRQNTAMVRSASRGASAIAIAELDRDIAKYPELARLWVQSSKPELAPFDELEQFQFATAARSLVGLLEDQYMQGVQGTAPKEQGEMYIAGIVGLLELPTWKRFWDTETAQPTWRQAFIDAVNTSATPYRIDAATFFGKTT
jgi:hypothetical protein